MTDSTGQRLFIERSDLRRTRVAPDPDAPASRQLEPGQTRLRIEQFALTSNNVTYAALGEEMKYWQFFPAGDVSLGCLPVWGFATVAESLAEGVTVGRRVWGFFPAGTHLVVQAARVTAAGFSDAAAHRQGLAGVYNRYAFCDADLNWQLAPEGLQTVLRPLFTTAFLLDDFLADNLHFDARRVLLSSASSKTALATAFCLGLRRGTPEAPTIVALTSPGHADFVHSLGCYDAVHRYDEVAALDASEPTVYIDFAGDAVLRHQIHSRLGPALRHSLVVGGTHGAGQDPGPRVPGPKPVVFLAAAQAARRSAPPPEGWGRAALEQRLARAWGAFIQRAGQAQAPWVTIVSAQGSSALQEGWLAALQGRTNPAQGLMFSLPDASPAASEPGARPAGHTAPPASASGFITAAPPDLDGWAALFDPQDLPVLASTAEALDELRPNEDKVDAHMLAEIIDSDPLMTIKVLSHLARLRRGREGSDTETVTAALLMLGVPPFFRAFGKLDTAEGRLADHPQALEGFSQVLRRARRAARFALGFAVHRMDSDAAILHEAALLHDFTELLLWLKAPALAEEIVRRQHADPALRSATAQRELLHIELEELRHALMKAWNLPALLIDFADEQAPAGGPQVRNVELAIRVARHSMLGWDDAALPDDLHDIGELLNLAVEPTARLLREIDAD